MVQAHARELLNQKEIDSGLPDHPLYAATERLIGALDRLETSLRRARVEAPYEMRQQGQLTAFEQENRALNATIAELKSQYGDLQTTASMIYTKLEDSIKRLTQIVES